MLQIQDQFIKEHLLEGNFGLEKESLRVLEDGRLSHTSHPFPDDEHIVKDFCENQTEINTSVHTSIKGAVEELDFHNQRIYQRLQSLSKTEYLWPFSNPPHIENEDDIPVAVFEGQHISKSAYRDYLSDKYGRYKMTFS
jgi:glutamate--cysteine ligase